MERWNNGKETTTPKLANQELEPISLSAGVVDGTGAGHRPTPNTPILQYSNTPSASARKPAKCLLLLQELRAPFFIAPLMPVFLGTAFAFARTGTCDGSLFLWAVIGVMLINASANVANDYFDHRSGNDEANTDFVRPFTGGSRMIQEGLLSATEIGRLALACTVLAVLAGIVLFLKAGPIVLILGAIGLAGGLMYSAPGINLSGRGLGEFVIALNVGVLPVVGAYFIQARAFTWDAVLLSLPLALLITAILFINQFQDCRADEAVGKRHWVVRLGRRRSVPVYALLMTLWPLPIVAGVLARLFSPWCLLSLLGLAPAAMAVSKTLRYYDNPRRLAPANALTIVTHIAVGALLTVATLAGGGTP